MNAQALLDAKIQADVARRVCGRFVGDDFDSLPGISAYGALVRTARLNHLRRHEFFAAYGLRTTRREDLSRTLVFSVKRKDQLALALGVNERERDLWDITEWLPFSGDLDWDSLPWEPRICPCCSRLGYHTLLFQLPRCPWHGTNLIRYCRRCARPLSEASPTNPLKCPCGSDHVNVREACRYRQSHMRNMPLWIEAYLSWAAAARESNRLFHAAKAEVSNWDALGQLIEMPPELQTRCGYAQGGRPRLHERALSIDDVVNASFGTVQHQFLGNVPVDVDGFLELPAATVNAFRGVGYELAEKLPEATFSDGELLRFFAGSRKRMLRFAATHRSGDVDILFLPVQVGGGRSFLCVSALAKANRDVAHRLGNYLKTATGHGEPALRAGLLALLRAYAEGMRVVVSRSVPVMFELSRDRPHLTLPWILVQQASGRVVRVKAVWAPRSDDCQASLSPPARKRRRRPPTALARRKQSAEDSSAVVRVASGQPGLSEPKLS